MRGFVIVIKIFTSLSVLAVIGCDPAVVHVARIPLHPMNASLVIDLRPTFEDVAAETQAAATRHGMTRGKSIQPVLQFSKPVLGRNDRTHHHLSVFCEQEENQTVTVSLVETYAFKHELSAEYGTVLADLRETLLRSFDAAMN